MTPADLLQRTREFSIRVIHLVDALPQKRSADAIARQLVRSGTSVGANYRAACRARSAAEFAAKLCIVVERADETLYWLDLIVNCKIMPAARVLPLLDEAQQLVAIFSKSRKTFRTTASRKSRDASPINKSPNQQINK